MLKKETDMIDRVNKALRSIIDGNLDVKRFPKDTGEFGETVALVAELTSSLKGIAYQVKQIAQGDYSADIEPRGEKDSLGLAMQAMTKTLREVSTVAETVAIGDFREKVAVKGKKDLLATSINSMVDTMKIVVAQVEDVSKAVGTEGRLDVYAKVSDLSGAWKGLIDNVNNMAGNLTDQVRNIALVTTAVAKGDLTGKITIDAKGEILDLKNTINTMVDQLSTFAGEVTRVAREVGTEGKLGGKAQVVGVSGTWKDLTDNVNIMADNLTDQVRNIALVTTAVAKGDLTGKITIDAKGEILDLKNTLNTMVDQLSTFAGEVTRVAREVGTEGKLGGSRPRLPGHPEPGKT